MSTDGMEVIGDLDSDVLEEATPASLLQRAAKQREANKKIDETAFDVPTWDGALRLNFKVIDKKEIISLAQRVRARSALTRDGEVNLTEVELAFLARCASFYEVINPDTGDFVTVGGWNDCATMLGVQNRELNADDAEDRKLPVCKTHSELLAYLCKYQDIRIATWAQAVSRWITTGRREAEEALGES